MSYHEMPDKLSPEAFIVLLARIEKLEQSRNDNSRTNKQLCEKINDVERQLENYRQYKTDIEDLETDVVYIKKILGELETKIITAVDGKGILWE